MEQRCQQLIDEARKAHIHTHVVGVVVEDGGHILLLKRRPDDFLPNMWEIPGGHLDPGESILDAVARELFEETGLRLASVVEYHGFYDYAGEFGPTRQWNFRVTVHPGDALAHPEHVAAIWANRQHWTQLPMTDEMRGLLDAL